MSHEDDILCGTLETSPGRAGVYHHPRTYTEWRAGWDTAHLGNSRIKHVSYLAAYYKYGEVPKNLETTQKPPRSSQGNRDESPWAWVKWRRDASTGVVVGGLPQKGYGLAGMAALDYTGAPDVTMRPPRPDVTVPGTPLRAPSCTGSVRAASVQSQRSAPPPVVPGSGCIRTSSAASSRRPAAPEKTIKTTPRRTSRTLDVAVKSEVEDPGQGSEVRANPGIVDAIVSPPLTAPARCVGREPVPMAPDEEQPAITEANAPGPASSGLSKILEVKKDSRRAQESLSSTPRTSRHSGLWRGAWRSSTLRCKNSAAMIGTAS